MVGEAMIRRQDFLAFLAGAMLFMSLGSPAPANVPTSFGLTGKVTGLPGGSQIEVDGRMYTIVSGSEAAQRIQGLHVGDVVDLKLEGAAPGRSNKATSFNVHTTR
jgi:hypothetical protein